MSADDFPAEMKFEESKTNESHIEQYLMSMLDILKHHSLLHIIFWGNQRHIKLYGIVEECYFSAFLGIVNKFASYFI